MALAILMLVAANLILTFIGIIIITRKEDKEMATIADLQTEVAALTTVEQSAAALLDGLTAQLKDALSQNDPAAIQKVIDDLDAGKASLADAVARNTSPAA